VKASDESADNLVARLFAYSPRPGRTPLEDFCTEALAWCLTISPVTAERWLNLIRSRLSPVRWKIIHGHQGRIAVATQEPFKPLDDDEENSAARFDLVIRPPSAAGFIMVIESKIAPAAHLKEQIQRYRQNLNAYHIEIAERCVIALTVGRHAVETADAQVTWSDVSACLEQCEDEYRPRFQEIIRFLRLKGLSPVKLPVFSPQMMEDFSAASPFLEAMQILFSNFDSHPALKETFARRHRERPVVNVDTDNGTSWFGIYDSVGAYAGLFVRKSSTSWCAGLYAEVPVPGDKRALAKHFESRVLEGQRTAVQEFPNKEEGQVQDGYTWFRFACAWPESGRAEEISEWFEEMFATVLKLLYAAPADGA
jgi:hypothetical protein